jgi:probable F420-dependent oxidoreductase
MEIGVVFPQTEIGPDPGAVRAYADAASDLGFHHLLIFEHVVGADPRVHEGWNREYDLSSNFHEPFVLMGYLAAVTSVELVTGIVILPQRQTVLVAKQAAEVDVLCRGRLRLGVGLGWNPVEYEALGRNFADRGERIGEQVELMRMLWTQDSVTFTGQYDKITGAGLTPQPVQRPIPIWFGGSAPRALRRVGRLADGWLVEFKPGSEELATGLELVREGAAEAGRDPSTIGLEARIEYAEGDHKELARMVAAWREAGATHLCLNMMEIGLRNVDEHIAELSSAARELFG